MREIKFRAWAAKSKDMIGWNRLKEGRVIDIVPQKDWFVMQYIGLNDKTWKDIYEGDILKRVNGDQSLVEIKWDHPNARFNAFNFGPGDGIYFGAEWAQELKIVGNIHQNPELLDGGLDYGKPTAPN